MDGFRANVSSRDKFSNLNTCGSPLESALKITRGVSNKNRFGQLELELSATSGAFVYES